MSVRLSARSSATTCPSGRISQIFDTGDFYENMSRNSRIVSNRGRNSGHCTWRPKYISLFPATWNRYEWNGKGLLGCVKRTFPVPFLLNLLLHSFSFLPCLISSTSFFTLVYSSRPFIMNTVTLHRSICTFCTLNSSSSHICALFGFSYILGTTFLHGKFPFNTNNFLNRFYSIKSWVLFIPVRLMTRMEPILKQAVWCLCHHVHRNTQRLSHRRTNEQPVTQTTGINISYISQHGESLPAVCQEITSRQCTKLHNTNTVLNTHARETGG